MALSGFHHSNYSAIDPEMSFLDHFLELPPECDWFAGCFAADSIFPDDNLNLLHDPKPVPVPEPFFFNHDFEFFPSLNLQNGYEFQQFSDGFTAPFSSPPEFAPPQPEKSSVSIQSAAARRRRRKITERTHELGKLVPGGQMMNTADMLKAAYKYIKFLEAQVGVLQVMNLKQGNETGDEEIQGLLQSPLIQEKLYNAEKCLVSQRCIEQVMEKTGESMK